MKDWERKEKKDAKLFNTKQQRGSGRSDFYPTDSISDTRAIETKQTAKKSYSVSLKTWQKLVNETAALNDKDGGSRIPILSVYIGGRHLVVVDFEDFKILEDKSEKSKT